MRTIGLIGSGTIGAAIAAAAIRVGHEVVLSNSRGPETLADLVAALGPRASAGTVVQAAAAGELVVVSIPLGQYRTVPVSQLVGKTVIDTSNYYPQRDGQIAELDDDSITVSELLQSHLRQSNVVKAFNHVGADDITSGGHPPGAAGRRALAIAGDNPAAKQDLSTLIEEFGFDVVDAGPLAQGWRFQRDTPAYETFQTAAELIEALAQAQRYADVG